jgi:hypothetical protein
MFAPSSGLWSQPRKPLSMSVSRAVLLRKTVDSVSIALKDSVCVSHNASMNLGVAA